MGRQPATVATLAVLAAMSCGRATTSSNMPVESRDEPPPASSSSIGIADPEVAFLPEGAPPPAPELPSPPTYSDSEVPDQYEGGIWSIRGLRKEMDARLKEGAAGKEVVVLVWLQEIYFAPPCPEQGHCPPAKQPHLWVTDEPDERGKRHALLVVDYKFQIPVFDEKRWKGQPQIVMEIGKRYRIRGRFTRASDSGFAHDRGLLEFIAVEVTDQRGQRSWVYPPGAPWHPLEVKRARARDIE